MTLANEGILAAVKLPKMHYRRFGKTNLSLSVFSLGTMRFPSRDAALVIVQQAIAAGINHLETARGYGQSERYLGCALKSLGLNRSELYLTTKISPTSDAALMARSIDESLERLGVDYVDCLAIHGVNTWEHLTWVEECMGIIQQAKAEGKVRHIGFSTHGPREVILAAIATQPFEFVNLHYYYFFQRHAPLLDVAQANDLGVFIISPADKGGMLYAPSSLLQELCHPISPLALTYRFLLSDRRISTLSLGAAAPADLEAALEVAHQTGPLSYQELEKLECLQRQQQQSLGSQQCSQCYACLPCPVEIQIPEVLRLRNLAVAYEMTEFGQYRYQMFEQAGHWFPGAKADRCTDCGDCLPRCPTGLDIPTLLRDTHQKLAGPNRRRLWNN